MKCRVVEKRLDAFGHRLGGLAEDEAAIVTRAVLEDVHAAGAGGAQQDRQDEVVEVVVLLRLEQPALDLDDGREIALAEVRTRARLVLHRGPRW